MPAQRLIFLMPVLTLLVLVGFFVYRLALIDQGDMPNVIPSVMIGKPAPVFVLPSAFEDKPQVNLADFRNRVTLVSVFASWCVACRAEHDFLADIKKAGITLVGLDYKDHRQDARAWLEKMGNPYDAVASDLDGRVGIDFGVYGVPESYLIDKEGIIRFKQTGPLTPADIRDTLLPLARELNR